MKLWIIYPKRFETNGSKSPYKMLKAATDNNISSEIMYLEYFRIVKEGKTEILYYKENIVKDYPTLVIFRCYKEDVMKYFEEKGSKVVNGFNGTHTIRDKYKTHLLIEKLGIKQPKFLNGSVNDFDYISRYLGIPFVMKNNTGAKGENVYLVKSKQEYENILNNHLNINFMYQEYIKESKGSDYRLYIVGDEVVGCVNRVSADDDFRANISQGGKGLACDLPHDIKMQSLLIAKTLGLEICSVDYLKKGDEYYFCEGNSNAGFLAFTRLGYNMQNIFMKYISQKYNQREKKEVHRR